VKIASRAMQCHVGRGVSRGGGVSDLEFPPRGWRLPHPLLLQNKRMSTVIQKLKGHLVAAHTSLAMTPCRALCLILAPLGPQVAWGLATSGILPQAPYRRRKLSPFLSTLLWESTSSTTATSQTPRSCATCYRARNPSSTAIYAPAQTLRSDPHLSQTQLSHRAKVVSTNQRRL
jgi:hypothetical protein